MRSRSAASAMASRAVPTAGRRGTSCSGAVPRPPGLASGSRRRRWRHPRRRDARARACTRVAQAAASLDLRSRRERRRQQDDAEIRVAARGGERRLDRAQDALADLERRLPRSDGAAASALLEMGDLHAVAAGVDVHVAGFQGVELGEAGGEEGLARSRSRSSRALARRPLMRAHGGRESPRRSASAMSTSVTLCRPRHAGLELTSSTRRRAVGARIRVDAGVVGIDGGDARRPPGAAISGVGCAGRPGLPPWCTLVIQVAAAAPHGGDDAGARGDDAPILESRVALPPDGDT